MKNPRSKKKSTIAESVSKSPSLRQKPSGRAAFQRQSPATAARAQDQYVHIYGDRVICETDARGYATPDNKSATEIVVDASGGFIPLWAKGATLRWRFQEPSLSIFEDTTAAKKAIEEILGEAILAWGDAAPVKFNRTDSNWDFEIRIRAQAACDTRGCVLASAFFPDAGRHVLDIYPTMLDQSRAEQINTLIHEIGHVFGLRHFFANISETGMPSEIFGVHRPVSIMNYGANSQLTADDKSDLKRLYQLAWNGQLTAINGTPIKFCKPFSVSNAVATGSPVGTANLAAPGAIWCGCARLVQSPNSQP